MTQAVLATLAARILLVLLFFPFSALDKICNFRGALAVLTGTADRAAGFVLAGYCIVTALLWKQFWKPGDFWAGGDSKGRVLFWDFLKNVSLAGGFLLLVVGTHGGVGAFLADPFASSQPYAGQHLP